jgi:hypothetical protein
MREIRQDIHKLADWIEKATREGVAIERKILEWKLEEMRSADVSAQKKVS